MRSSSRSPEERSFPVDRASLPPPSTCGSRSPPVSTRTTHRPTDVQRVHPWSDRWRPRARVGAHVGHRTAVRQDKHQKQGAYNKGREVRTQGLRTVGTSRSRARWRVCRERPTVAAHPRSSVRQSGWLARIFTKPPDRGPGCAGLVRSWRKVPAHRPGQLHQEHVDDVPDC
jgi:hypothetical protein